MTDIKQPTPKKPVKKPSKKVLAADKPVISDAAATIPEAIEPVTPTNNGSDPGTMSEDIYYKVAEAAYYRAADRGFHPGQDQKDWFEAEREVRRNLSNPQRAAMPGQ